MPKIPDEIVKRIQDAADIVKVVGESVRLRKAGVNYTGLCPFHEDRHTGNFIVTPKGSRKHGNQYHCFVCGAHGNSLDFLQKHDGLTFPDAVRYLGRMTCIEVDNVPVNYTPPPPRPAPPPLPDLLIPRPYVSRTIEIASQQSVPFIAWLYTLPWDDVQRTRLAEVLWMYCVGGWRDGRVVFWMIDHDGNPRAAKLMQYLPDGHRDKQVHPGWIYNQDGVRQRLNPDRHNILKPLFGSHLLRRYPNAVVNIVESEKTAIIMATYYGGHDQQLWLACGGLKHLQLESMQPLIDQGRIVWLWPDKDGREAWQEVADKLGYDKCRVYTHFFDTCWTEADGDKADVADIAIRMMTTGDKPRHTGDGQGTTEQSATASDQSGATPAPTPEQQKPDGVTDEEWTEHLKIMADIKGWQIAHPDEINTPFLDPIELQDPRVREWREKLRQAHPMKWDTIPVSKVEGVKAVGELLQDHPLVKKLLKTIGDKNDEHKAER